MGMTWRWRIRWRSWPSTRKVLLYRQPFSLLAWSLALRLCEHTNLSSVLSCMTNIRLCGQNPMLHEGISDRKRCGGDTRSCTNQFTLNLDAILYAWGQMKITTFSARLRRKTGTGWPMLRLQIWAFPIELYPSISCDNQGWRNWWWVES